MYSVLYILQQGKKTLVEICLVQITASSPWSKSTVAAHFGGLLAGDERSTLAADTVLNVDHISSNQSTAKHHGEDPPTR